MKLSEKQYIRYRKLKAFGNKLVFMICRVFPVKRNKIAVCTFEGRGGFGDNPKYIVEELHKRNDKYRFVWLVNDTDKVFPDYIKAVKNGLWNRAYHLSTSKIWIDNYRKPYGTVKRRGQYYLQTWHGAIAFKTLGLWRGEKFSEMAYLVSKNDSDMIDCCIADSDWGLEAFPKGLVYHGSIKKLGQARCDILINRSIEHKNGLRKRYHLPMDIKLVMFAPTFRESSNEGVRGISIGNSSIDFARLIAALQRKFGGEWCLCMRLHPQLAALWKSYPVDEIRCRMVDMSTADDMCELMAGIDVLVTDYSSAAMDAGFADIPVFLYADDIGKYTDDRGGLFWQFPLKGNGPLTVNKELLHKVDTELPFLLARNNDELEENIDGFDEEKYKQKIHQVYKDIDLVNDGYASKRAADIVEEWMMRDERY